MKFAERMLRLYAVTDRSWLGAHTLAGQVEAALRGGATCVQLREKELDPEAFLEEARELKGLCARYGVPLIIGPDRILGVTAKTVEQARKARQAGADYLGSGAVFGSTTKLNAKPMSRELLQAICESAGIPVVAIGGIHRGNIARLAGTGIRGAAVVSGIFAAADIEAECRLLRAEIAKIVP